MGQYEVLEVYYIADFIYLCLLLLGNVVLL